ncbi:MAG: ATP-binding cassette domain-containing protein [Gemmatimonadota bacterium]|nr:ATP-binding cassette domain-containing protein [Gemmatimonadota bacterium]MDH3421856.1 ATP-binding cassette domain-containing protein [Gemmatimonadota bacterium]
MSIEMVNVHKAFDDQEVLRGFSLTIPDGETVSVIGGSGSGKSVALKHIVGLLKPDEGDVWIDGENVGRLDRESVYQLRRNVGYVFQFAALFDSMTITENVGMGLARIAGLDRKKISARVEECLHMVDLDGYGDRMPSELSGGQRKRVGFARAIATQPKYLLYDEPTTGLDPVTSAVIDALIVRMGDELGVTGVVITHDMKSAFRISDRIAMLYEGRIRFVGTPTELQITEDPVVKGFIEGRPELMESERR